MVALSALKSDKDGFYDNMEKAVAIGVISNIINIRKEASGHRLSSRLLHGQGLPNENHPLC